MASFTCWWESSAAAGRSLLRNNAANPTGRGFIRGWWTACWRARARLRRLVAQASFHPGSKAPEQQLVAKGQQLLWERKICRPGPVTDDLLGGEFRHDGVHFNQKGLATHADRWFEALSGAFQWKTYSSTSPEAEFKRVDRPVTVEIAPVKPSESIR